MPGFFECRIAKGKWNHSISEDYNDIDPASVSRNGGETVLDLLSGCETCRPELSGEPYGTIVPAYPVKLDR